MKNQPCLAARTAAAPGHLEGVDDERTPHVFSQGPAPHLAVEQIHDHRQKQPSFVGRDVGKVGDPYLVGLGHSEVAIQEVRSNRQTVSAVRGRDPETALAAGANAVLLHQPLHPLLAHANALSPQLPPDPRPAVGSAIRRINGADMHQQRLITQMATLHNIPSANQVFMVTGHAPPQNSTLHADGPHPPVTLNKGVLHFWPFAKYAVAFPRMSRSILTRANSARKRLISICSALTALLRLVEWRPPRARSVRRLSTRMILRIGVGLGCGILGLTRLAPGALKSLSGDRKSTRVGGAKVLVDGFDGGVIWVVGVRGEVAGDADVDVFLGHVVLVNEDLADLVGVVGIFAVLGVATFDKEA